MKRMAFPIVVIAILVAGVLFSATGNAARKGVSEEALLRSGQTVDYSCGAVATDGTTANAEPMQLAAAIKCEQYADGSCVAENSFCGTGGGKKKSGNSGVCTTVTNKQKQQTCACVK